MIFIGLTVLRHENILSQMPSTIDIFLISIVFILLILPLISEITIGNVSIKKELDDTKKEINSRIDQLKLDLVNSIAVSPTIQVGNIQPLSDEAIQRISDKFENTVDSYLQKYSNDKKYVNQNILEIDDRTMLLFNIRLNIEKELRRIWGNRNPLDSKWPTTVHYMSTKLAMQDIIPLNLMDIIKEVYNICSPAIHGETVTDQQINFVKDIGPKIIATLKEIE